MPAQYRSPSPGEDSLVPHIGEKDVPEGRPEPLSEPNNLRRGMAIICAGGVMGAGLWFGSTIGSFVPLQGIIGLLIPAALITVSSLLGVLAWRSWHRGPSEPELEHQDILEFTAQHVLVHDGKQTRLIPRDRVVAATSTWVKTGRDSGYSAATVHYLDDGDKDVFMRVSTEEVAAPR